VAQALDRAAGGDVEGVAGGHRAGADPVAAEEQGAAGLLPAVGDEQFRVLDQQVHGGRHAVIVARAAGRSVDMTWRLSDTPRTV